MRGIIQDQLSHTFFEGPTQSFSVNAHLSQGPAENIGNPPPKPVDEHTSKGNNDDQNIPYYKAIDPTE